MDQMTHEVPGQKANPHTGHKMPMAQEQTPSTSTPLIKNFTGRFVMHCHILDHEELGMMEVDDVVKDVITPMKTESVEMLHEMQ